jgi:hypothetical protein
LRTHPKTEESADVRGSGVGVAAEPCAGEADKCAGGREAGDSQAKPASSRAAFLESLSTVLVAALAAGDIEVARIANEAIGRLLGAAGSEQGAVVDLAAERVRRER